MATECSFLPFYLTLFAFIFIFLLKIVDFFKKKICTLCNENGDFTGFSKLTGG